MRGCWGACMVAGGHAWLLVGMCGCCRGIRGCRGSMHGCWGACVVARSGMCGCQGVHGCWGVSTVGGHTWLPEGIRGCQGGVHDEGGHVW